MKAMNAIAWVVIGILLGACGTVALLSEQKPAAKACGCCPCCKPMEKAKP